MIDSNSTRLPTVKELYQLDEDDIFDRTYNSEYWRSVSSFYDDVKDKTKGQLSSAQIDWLDKIRESLQND